MSIYCVYVTFYRGNKLPPFYIGSSSIERINNGYRGSVSSKKYMAIWKNELKNNPHLFVTHIISTHTERGEATTKELKLQKQLSVTNHPLYINESYAAKNFMYGKNRSPCTAETARKIGRANKGRPSPMKGRKQIETNPNYQHNRAMLGKKHTFESRKQMSASRKGKTRSESHNQNQKNAVSGKNANTAIKVHIYNAHSVLMFSCEGNFDKICNENNLPKEPLRKSYQNDASPIYLNTGKHIKTNNRLVNWERYIGWYAEKIIL